MVASRPSSGFPWPVKPPQAFRRDAHRIRERAEILAAGAGQKANGSEARAFAQEINDFVRRWQSHIQIPELRVKLVAFVRLARRIEVTWEIIRLDQTRELVSTRMQWQLAQSAFEAIRLLIDINKTSTPEQRAELDKSFQEDTGQGFDPEREYREYEKHLDACEGDFQAAWRQFETDWPEPEHQSIRVKLLAAPSGELKSWLDELLPQIARLRVEKESLK